MIEDLLTKNPMDEDLLTNIQRETHERLHELHDAMDEHDRLQAELRALEVAPEVPVALELPAALDTASGLTAALEMRAEPPVAPEGDAPSRSPAAADVASELSVAPEPPGNVVPLPTRPQLPRTRMVSPKVARLMHAPRRPALERAGVVRVGAGRLDSSTDELVEEVDSKAALYKRSI